jgi:hypothetical protein
VKKLIGLGLLLLVACQRKVEVSSPTPSTSTPSGAVGVTGGATTTEAIAGFMAAAKAEDLQAVGRFWGDPDGLTRDKWPRSEFEMRAFYIVKCLRHDRYAVLNEGNAAGGRRVAVVQLVKGVLNKQTNFKLVRGKDGRWLVENVELEPLTQICQQ